jgi:uncharacterized YkwD family protein
MGFKKTKLAVASLMLASLAACSTNKADINDTVRDTRNNLRTMNDGDVRTQNLDRVNLNRANDLDRRDNNNLLAPRNVSTGDWDRANNRLSGNRNNNGNITTNQVDTGNMLYKYNTTTEIQPMNNGFITIAHNSYSTDTPSHRFPHSQLVKQGNYWYYTFNPAESNQQLGMVTPQRGTQTGQQTAPQRGTQTGRQTAPTTPSTQQPTTQAPAAIGQMAQQVITLTNNERKKAGLQPLQPDASLSKVAQTKTNDMEAKHYFSHTSPTYGSPFDMMRDFGVTYRSAGENIAMGQTTAQQVVTAWMNSEGHRKNILSPSFTNIGVGFTSNGNYWSQMFIGK